jgi:transcription antitermination factor NusA-like protein
MCCLAGKMGTAASSLDNFRAPREIASLIQSITKTHRNPSLTVSGLQRHILEQLFTVTILAERAENT